MKYLNKILAGVLALVMMFAMTASVATPAFASATNTDGKIKINVNSNATANAGVTYKGYNIFKADVSANGKSISNIDWSSNAMRDAIVPVLVSAGFTFTPLDASVSTSANPQDAADFFSELANDNPDYSETYVLPADDVLNSVAKALKNFSADTTLTAGTEKTGIQTGYWLFVTDAPGNGQMGTAPIFTTVGTSSKTIQSKASIPTVDKSVKGHGDSNYRTDDHATAGIGENISYKLDGTLPANLATFSSFAYTFEDAVSAGLTIDPNSVVVKINDTTVASGYTKNLANNKLTVSFANLFAAKDAQDADITVTASSHVYVEYTAQLNENAKMGTATPTNSNTVKITYSNNPNNTTTSDTTVTDIVNVYTFELKLFNVDVDTNDPIGDTEVTIKEDGANGKYIKVNNDGTISYSETPQTITVPSTGLSAKGLPAGTYIVNETTAPNNYKKIDPDSYKFTIGAEYEGDSLTALSNEVSPAAGSLPAVIAGLDQTNDRTLNATEGTAAVLSTGTVNVTMGSVKDVEIPLSGQTGMLLGIFGGCLIIFVSVVALRKNKAHNNA